MIRRSIGATVVALALVLGIALPASAQGSPTPPRPTITAIVAGSGGAFDNNPHDFDLLLRAVKTAGLADALAAPGHLTVFAPDDRAFVALARALGYHGRDERGAYKAIVGALTTLGNGNPVPVLKTVLLYHVLPVQLKAYKVSQRHTLATLAGIDIRPDGFRLRDQAPALRDPRMIAGRVNLAAANGIVHAVNRVLLPIAVP
jgi:uncharacterized surface protein with fasciclin (FAS1) repeats